MVHGTAGSRDGKVDSSTISVAISRLLSSDPISRAVYVRVSPPLLGAGMLGAGIVVLGLSFLANTNYALNADHENVGYWSVAKWNWGLLYVTVVPVLVMLSSFASRWLAKAVVRLYLQRAIRPAELSGTLRTDRSEVDATELLEFVDEFARRLGRRTSTWMAPLLITIAFTIADTHVIWGGVTCAHLCGGDLSSGHYYREHDFTVAFANWNLAPEKPTLAANVLFDGFAYALQTVLVFLGLLYAVRFRASLVVLAAMSTPSPLRFPGDTGRRYEYAILAGNELKINPLGRTFNGFLAILLALALYLFAHRLSELPKSASEQWRAVWHHLRVGQVQEAISRIDLELLVAGLDAGQVLTAVILLAAVATITYYPMWRWRNVLAQSVEELEDELERTKVEKNLLQLRGQDTYRIVECEKRCTQLANALGQVQGQRLWPNGNAAAGFVFALIGGCAIGTLIPIAFPLGALAGLVAVMGPRFGLGDRVRHGTADPGGRRVGRASSPRTTRVLILMANPVSLEPLDLEEEVRAVEDAFARSSYRDQVVLLAKVAVRAEDLIRLLREFRPTIVHFGGHGGAQNIAVRTDGGEVRDVTLGDLCRLCKDAGVELVVVNACWIMEKEIDLGSTVRVLVGATGKLEDRDALEFARTFYRELGDGQPVGPVVKNINMVLGGEGTYRVEGDEAYVACGFERA